jgi:hypothetical protein
MAGQKKALDTSKQDAICNLVASGVSIRQAARYVDCDPKSIRREAGRNDAFRGRLQKAKSEVKIRPVQTLLEAAQDDWRAALSWMECVDPDRFARPEAAIVTKREANQFVADLIAAVEKEVKNPNEQNRLFRVLTPAMPTAMRRNWEISARRRAAQNFDRRQAERAEKRRLARRAHDDRRSRLWNEIADWLPWKLYDKLLKNHDLFDPEEVFGQTPGDNRTPGEIRKDALADVPRHYKPGSKKSEEYVALHSDFEQPYSWEEWCALPQAERERISSERERKRNLLANALWPAGQSTDDAATDDAATDDAATDDAVADDAVADDAVADDAVADDAVADETTPDKATKGASLIAQEASPATNIDTPLGRLSGNNASPPSADPKPPNDLPSADEAPSPE